MANILVHVSFDLGLVDGGRFGSRSWVRPLSDSTTSAQGCAIIKVFGSGLRDHKGLSPPFHGFWAKDMPRKRLLTGGFAVFAVFAGN
jgi:hypothetical protein